MMKVKIKKLRKNTVIPRFSKHEDAGADCYISMFSKILYAESPNGNIVKSLKETLQHIMLFPNSRIACHLGFVLEIPDGYYMQVTPRSGNGMWKGLTVINSVGIIDSGYRGEVMATIVNLGNKNQILKVGDKICQIILRKLVLFEFENIDSLPGSERGKNGFGSTDQKPKVIPDKTK